MTVQRHQHRIEVCGDVLRIDLIGVVDEQAVAEMVSGIAQILEKHSHYFALVDASQLLRITPGARHASAQSKSYDRCAGNVIIGAGFMARTFLGLVLRGMNLVLSNKVPTHFLQTEQEALRWVDRRRAELQG